MAKVIIDEVKFFLEYESNIYIVHAYAQDIEESDLYTVIISDENNEGIFELEVDSCGGATDDISDNKLINKVLDILFNEKQQGIIKEF